MLSSTSSSNQRLPSLPWLRLWLPALLLVLALIGLLEMRLMLRGFAPTQLDSEARWLEERSRASSDGRASLVLIGASRIQLGIDVALLQKLSGRPTHQLAIDGSSYWPVLRGLAEDQEFKGTVVVDYYQHIPLDDAYGGLAASYERHYQQKKNTIAPMALRPVGKSAGMALARPAAQLCRWRPSPGFAVLPHFQSAADATIPADKL